MMGYSRDSFYRFKKLYDKGGELGCRDQPQEAYPEDRTALEIEQAVVEMAIEQPAWGQMRVSQAVKRRGLSISPAGARCVWQRHDPSAMKLRLNTLETQDGAARHPVDGEPDRRTRKGRADKSRRRSA